MSIVARGSFLDRLKRKVEEQTLRAQRDALIAEAERGAGGGRRAGVAVRGQYRRLCQHLGREPNHARRQCLYLGLALG